MIDCVRHMPGRRRRVYLAPQNGARPGGAAVASRAPPAHLVIDVGCAAACETALSKKIDRLSYLCIPHPDGPVVCIASVVSGNTRAEASTYSRVRWQLQTVATKTHEHGRFREPTGRMTNGVGSLIDGGSVAVMSSKPAMPPSARSKLARDLRGIPLYGHRFGSPSFSVPTRKVPQIIDSYSM